MLFPCLFLENPRLSYCPCTGQQEKQNEECKRKLLRNLKCVLPCYRHRCTDRINIGCQKRLSTEFQKVIIQCPGKPCKNIQKLQSQHALLHQAYKEHLKNQIDQDIQLTVQQADRCDRRIPAKLHDQEYQKWSQCQKDPINRPAKVRKPFHEICTVDPQRTG